MKQTDPLDTLKEKAEAGDATAQMELGRCYYFGSGVEKNPEEAVKWYKMAAEAGDSSAQANLGVMYKHGEGVSRDLVQSARWWQKAAETGNPNAARSLSRCYLEGEGVPPDQTLAYAYLSFYRMVEGGNDDVKALLRQIERELTVAQRGQAQAKAKELYEKARTLRENS